MKNNINILVFALLLFTTSCETETEIKEMKYQKKIVVNSLFSNEKAIEVDVSQSRSVLDKNSSFDLEGSKVQLLYSGGTIDLFFDTIDKKYYLTNHFLPVPGTEYTIQVQSPGFVTARSTTKLIALPQNLVFELIENTSVDSDGVPQDQLRVSLLDHKGEENYYQMQLYYYSSTQLGFMPFVPENADSENTGLFRNSDNSFLFSDKNKDGQTISFKFTIPFDQSTGTPRFMIEFFSLSKDYYEYERTQTLYNQGEAGFGSLFFEPVQIYSNISNGLGIFAGKTIVRDTIF